MPREKLGNRTEAVRWLAEGKTYAWCVDEHLRRYNVKTSLSMWAKLRKQAGLERRITRDETLIPWEVKPEHRWAYPLVMLRFEAKRRAGKQLSEQEVSKVDPFLAKLDEQALVVYYDADTEEGFFLVPREPQDADIVRQPPASERSKRHAQD